MSAMELLLARRWITPAGCWQFCGSLNNYGYGRVKVAGREYAAHRVAYEHARGPIPADKQIDHLCRNRACFNPEHLEVVTSRENTLRGDTITARAAKATHCPKGHPYDELNTYRTPRGHRDCRTCRAESGRRRYV